MDGGGAGLAGAGGGDEGGAEDGLGRGETHLGVDAEAAGKAGDVGEAHGEERALDAEDDEEHGECWNGGVVHGSELIVGEKLFVGLVQLIDAPGHHPRVLLWTCSEHLLFPGLLGEKNLHLGGVLGDLGVHAHGLDHPGLEPDDETTGVAVDLVDVGVHEASRHCHGWPVERDGHALQRHMQVRDGDAAMLVIFVLFGLVRVWEFLWRLSQVHTESEADERETDGAHEERRVEDNAESLSFKVELQASVFDAQGTNRHLERRLGDILVAGRLRCSWWHRSVPAIDGLGLGPRSLQHSIPAPIRHPARHQPHGAAQHGPPPHRRAGAP